MGFQIEVALNGVPKDIPKYFIVKLPTLHLSIPA